MQGVLTKKFLKAVRQNSEPKGEHFVTSFVRYSDNIDEVSNLRRFAINLHLFDFIAPSTVHPIGQTVELALKRRFDFSHRLDHKHNGHTTPLSLFRYIVRVRRPDAIVRRRLLLDLGVFDIEFNTTPSNSTTNTNRERKLLPKWTAYCFCLNNCSMQSM